MYLAGLKWFKSWFNGLEYLSQNEEWWRKKLNYSKLIKDQVDENDASTLLTAEAITTIIGKINQRNSFPRLQKSFKYSKHEETVEPITKKISFSTWEMNAEYNNSSSTTFQLCIWFERISRALQHFWITIFARWKPNKPPINTQDLA